MDTGNKLRNNLIRKIQHLSEDNLSKVSEMLSQLEGKFKSKDKTLKLAGTWKNLDENIFSDFTEKLHENRIKDRQI